MPWNRVDGKRVYFQFPWHSDPDFHAKMRALGKGNPSWYIENKWILDYKVVGNLTFQVGRGTNAFEFPSYSSTDERRRVAKLDSLMKVSRRAKKAYRATEGLLADPLTLSPYAMRTFRGSMVIKSDVRLAHRLTQFIGMVAANPGIHKRQVAAIFNTTQVDIDRLICLARAYLVSFTGLGVGRLRIESYGVLHKESLLTLYKLSNGLEEMVEESSVLIGDPADGRTGKVDQKQVKLNLARLWERKLALDKQQQ